MNETADHESGGSNALLYFLYVLVSVLGTASLIETRLAVLAVLLLVIGLAQISSEKRLPAPLKRLFTWLMGVGLSLSILGVGRFIFQEALPGIAEAHGRDSSKRAVSLLREIYFAQNAMRRYAMIDPDGDRIGSAGRLGELSGYDLARGKDVLSTPPLSPRLAPRIETAQGPATEHEGYLIIVCLPTASGSWTARPEVAVDEEGAERNWIAYAWPAAPNLPNKSAYAIDEHEGIFEFENQKDGELSFVGALHVPDCGALRSQTGVTWSAWGGKQARPDLPGDK